jgi:hypothetical protein
MGQTGFFDVERRLEAIVADRCTPQKHVWRAQIILATANGRNHG